MTEYLKEHESKHLTEHEHFNVYKFGGTSFKKFFKIDVKDLKLNRHNVFVFSAMEGITNLLSGKINNIDKMIKLYESFVNDLGLKIDLNDFTNMNKQLIHDENNRNLYVNKNCDIALGELYSSYIAFKYCEMKYDLKVKWYDIRNLMLYKNDQYIFHNYHEFEKYDIIFLGGYIARDINETTVLMSRGGGDSTGAIISNQLNVNKYFIYTDVDGIYNCDPRLTNKAKRLDKIDVGLLQEASALGAKVVHPQALQYLNTINTYVCKSDLSNNNTLITNLDSNDDYILTVKKDVVLVNYETANMWHNYGFVEDIFKMCKQKKIDVDIVVTSQFSVSFTIDKKDIDKIDKTNDKYKINISDEKVVLSLCMNNIHKKRVTVNKFLDSVCNNVDDFVTHYGCNNKNISIIVDNNCIQNIINQFMT